MMSARRAFVLGAIVGAGVLAGVVASAAAPRAVVRVSHPRIRPEIPAPGHVTLAAIKLRFAGKRASKLPRHLRFKLTGTRRLPRHTTLITAVQTRRTKTAVTYTILMALVNPRSSASRTLSAHADEPRLPPLINLSAAGLNAYSQDAFGAGYIDTPPDQALAEGNGYVFEAVNNVFQISDTHFSVSWSESDNIDEGTKAQRSKADIGFGETLLRLAPTGTLLVVLRDPALDTGRYDSSHLSGWKFNAPSTTDAIRESFGLATAPDDRLGELLAKIGDDLSVNLAPPPPAQVQITEFDTWVHNTDIHKSNICINVKTTPPQASISASLTGPNNFKANLPITPLHPDGTRQVGAQINQAGDYTKTLIVYDATGKQTATVTKTFTVLPPPPDGPPAGPVPPFGPPCPKPS